MSEQHIKLPEGSIEKTTTTLNLGPTHPATHGVFQNILELDGERIVSADSTVGYIHRAFEKIAERRPLYQITPLTDRLNYCSSPINNMGWHLTCEKLLGVKTPKRVDYLRVIIMELARISDHLICNSIVGVDAGAGGSDDRQRRGERANRRARRARRRRARDRCRRSRASIRDAPPGSAKDRDG